MRMLTNKLHGGSRHGLMALATLALAASAAHGQAAVPPEKGSAGSDCAAGTVIHQDTGCTAGGFQGNLTAAAPEICCGLCAANASCNAWTFHPPQTCLVVATPVVVKRAETQGLTCGCRLASCGATPPTAPTPQPPCDPVKRPAAPKLRPLPPGSTRPHFVSFLIDDLGYDDTSINGNTGITFTPQIQALADGGIRLARHHTYLWCSPTRRAFLSGRYPTHITGAQAPQCSNFLPLQFTILSEKLAAAGYESVFVGKGHLGWHTEDHLMVNRGFEHHIGYLGGGESYKWGGVYGSSDDPRKIVHHDMWSDDLPATELVDTIVYSTEFYTEQGLAHIHARNTSRPFWLHLAYQAVHGGTFRQEVPVQDCVDPATVPKEYPHFQNGNYGSVTHALDNGIGNITAALRAAGMWDETLIVFTADNGGDCGLPAQPGVGGAPGAASNYPLLGRKCTAFEGGTRVAAFVAGGLIPAARRGTVSTQLIYITDWYPTFCGLAGVDPTDDWVDPATQKTHPIDGVDVWAALSTGADGVTNPVREWLPTTERSLLWNDGHGHMWKLITSENKANRFNRNGTQYMDTANECIPNATELARVRHGRLTVPKSCVVCSATSPCLFDVLADPTEEQNVAKANPDIVGSLTTKLAGFNDPYIPSALTPANLACWNCTDSDSNGVGRWGDFWGPCCVRKTA